MILVDDRGCAAWKCKRSARGEMPDLRGHRRPENAVFCWEHERNVPKHLRDAIHAEVNWLGKHGRQPGHVLSALVTLAAGRELEHRLKVDPEAEKTWNAARAEERAKVRAGQLGIVGPDGARLGEPVRAEES